MIFFAYSNVDTGFLKRKKLTDFVSDMGQEN